MPAIGQQPSATLETCNPVAPSGRKSMNSSLKSQASGLNVAARATDSITIAATAAP